MLERVSFREFLCWVAGFIAAGVASTAADETSRQAEEAVRAEDLVRQVAIIGRLGRPVGEMVTVCGTWYRLGATARLGECCFRVTQVNGEPLRDPLIWDEGSIEACVSGKPMIPVAGATWELRGSEGGAVLGMPEAALVEARRQFVKARGMRFACDFGYIRSREVTTASARRSTPLPGAGQVGKSEPKRKVAAGELLSRVKIIGCLGRPLGQMVTIQGTWKDDRRLKGDMGFVTTHVDGTPLAAPVVFPEIAIVAVLDATTVNPVRDGVLELRGFESGMVFGDPPAAIEEGNAEVQQNPSYGFLPIFCYIYSRSAGR
jgi:hypothetical protein